MESLTKETITTSRNLIYTYYTSNLKTPCPIVLCIRGWPDTAALWSDFITNHLLQHNYGVIALDCLGYGGSSKPIDPGYYMLRDMAKDVMRFSIMKASAKSSPWVTTGEFRWVNAFTITILNVSKA